MQERIETKVHNMLTEMRSVLDRERELKLRKSVLLKSWRRFNANMTSPPLHAVPFSKKLGAIVTQIVAPIVTKAP